MTIDELIVRYSDDPFIQANRFELIDSFNLARAGSDPRVHYGWSYAVKDFLELTRQIRYESYKEKSIHYRQFASEVSKLLIENYLPLYGFSEGTTFDDIFDLSPDFETIHPLKLMREFELVLERRLAPLKDEEMMVFKYLSGETSDLLTARLKLQETNEISDEYKVNCEPTVIIHYRDHKYEVGLAEDIDLERILNLEGVQGVQFLLYKVRDVL